MIKPNYFAQIAVVQPKINYLISTSNIRNWIGKTNQLHKNFDFKNIAPRIGSTVESTAYLLFKMWMRDRHKYKNTTEMRFTYSYFLGFMKTQLNQNFGCHINTVKNHIKRLIDQYDSEGNLIHKGIFSMKYRDTLQMDDRNTVCIVLNWRPETLHWEQTARNKAKLLNLNKSVIADENRFTATIEPKIKVSETANPTRNVYSGSVGGLMQNFNSAFFKK